MFVFFSCLFILVAEELHLLEGELQLGGAASLRQLAAVNEPASVMNACWDK